jgi:hypothetical protein
LAKKGIAIRRTAKMSIVFFMGFDIDSFKQEQINLAKVILRGKFAFRQTVKKSTFGILRSTFGIRLQSFGSILKIMNIE